MRASSWSAAGWAALPLVNHFLSRAGLAELLARYLPVDDARLRLAPAAAIRLVVLNLLVGPGAALRAG